MTNVAATANASSAPTPLWLRASDAQNVLLKEMLLVPPGVSVGSGPSSSLGSRLQLDDAALAQNHLRVFWDGQGATVCYLGRRAETAPTLLAGAPIQRGTTYPWAVGQPIEIGMLRLTLEQKPARGASSPLFQGTNPMPVAAATPTSSGRLEMHLDEDDKSLQFTPGQTGRVRLTLVNKGAAANAWVSVVAPVEWLQPRPQIVALPAGGQQVVTLPIKVPPDGSMGRYRVRVRAEVEGSPSDWAEEDGQWDVAYQPGVSRLSIKPDLIEHAQQGSYKVVLHNGSNRRSYYELTVHSDDPNIQCTLNHQQAIIEPGVTSQELEVTVRARQAVDAARTHAITVRATSDDKSELSHAAQFRQIPQHARWFAWLLPAAVLLATLAAVALVIAAIITSFFPKPSTASEGSAPAQTARGSTSPITGTATITPGNNQLQITPEPPLDVNSTVNTSVAQTVAAQAAGTVSAQTANASPQVALPNQTLNPEAATAAAGTAAAGFSQAVRAVGTQDAAVAQTQGAKTAAAAPPTVAATTAIPTATITPVPPTQTTTPTPPTVSVSALVTQQAEGNTGDTANLQFRVFLSAASNVPVSVDYQITSSGGKNRQKVTPTSGTISILENQVSQLIDVPIVGDNVDEEDEVVSVTLIGTKGAILLANSAATTVIRDDDDPPFVSIDTKTPSVKEDVKQVDFNISISSASDKQITIRYRTEEGTAISGKDYTSTDDALSFAPGGTTSQSFSINLAGNNNFVDGNRQFSISLYDESNVKISTKTVFITIEDDDSISIVITGPTNGITEGSAAKFEIETSPKSKQDVIVSYVITYPASSQNFDPADASDYQLAEKANITLKDGSGKLEIPIVDDAKDERDEQFIISFTSNLAKDPQNYTVTIIDNDGPSIGFEREAQDVLKSPGAIAINLKMQGDPSPQDILVKIEVSGTANQGVDYTGFSTSIFVSAKSPPKPIIINIISSPSFDDQDKSIIITIKEVANGEIDNSNKKTTIRLVDNALLINATKFTKYIDGKVYDQNSQKHNSWLNNDAGFMCSQGEKVESRDINEKGTGLLYTISRKIVKDGSLYIWLRANAQDSGSDSSYINLSNSDGDNRKSLQQVDVNSPASSQWTHRKADVSPSSDGDTFTIAVWMRDPNFCFDRLLISSEAGLSPNDMQFPGQPVAPPNLVSQSISYRTIGSTVTFIWEWHLLAPLPPRRVRRPRRFVRGRRP